MSTSEYPIPEPFKWDETFKVEYTDLDGEHDQLFQGIEDVANHRDDATKLTHLQEVVEKHFKTEEEKMANSSYPDLESHKVLHSDFLVLLKGKQCPVDDDTVKYAKEWLVNHIKSTDFKYKTKLQ